MTRFGTHAAALVLLGIGSGVAWAQAEVPSAADPASAADAAAAGQPPVANEALPTLENLTEQVRKSVVVITSSGRDGRREGMGAGFVISDDGLVATNYHVIGQGRALSVQTADGRDAEVTQVHASDRALDLAVLRIDVDDLPVLPLGDSDQVRQGQDVIALGNPRGLKYSVVSGLVSGVRDVDGRSMIQLAMPIEPGNSGGPLVDRRGRVQGILTMKSLVTPNLGFALSINLLKPLLDKPNPIPLARWQTIGALDPREWTPVFGAHWRQRAGRILVEGFGSGFGGRSLCLSEQAVPERPFEIAVSVRLDDESGAAGLAFCSDGQDHHYGFYPTNGQLRLTRFEGPDVQSWSILHSEPSRHYASGKWNTLRVRLEEDKIRCFVNDEPVVEMADSRLKPGQVGLVKFRNTNAEFKNFQLGSQVAPATVPKEQARRIIDLVEDLPADGPLDQTLVGVLSIDPAQTASVLRDEAAQLDARAEQLRNLARAAHERHVIDDLVRLLSREESEIDLFAAGLLVARLDNEEVDVNAYREEIERMSREFADTLPDDADDAARLAALGKYLFEENGFHGSRGDYYNRANSYLNEVLDDREGLPIYAVGGVHGAGAAHRSERGGRRIARAFCRGLRAGRGRAAIDRRFRRSTRSQPRGSRAADSLAGDGEMSDDQIAKFFEPATKRSIIFRMLQNLLGLSRNDPAALHRYLNAMLAIEPAHGPYHLLRAMVRYQLDERDQALADVAWLLEHEPAGVNLDQVRALQIELERQ